MIDDGLFEKFDIEEVYAMHNIPGMKLGAFATRKGTITASENLFEITFEGKGGHAALPHMTKDIITIGSQIYTKVVTLTGENLEVIDL